jgi:hypothetical protein
MEHRITRAVDPKRSRRHLELLDPGFFEHLIIQGDVPPDIAWLIMVGQMRDDFPWAYEIGMRVYRALESGSASEVKRAVHEYRRVMQILVHSPVGEELTNDKRAYIFFREGLFDRALDRIAHLTLSNPRRKKEE